MNNNMTMFQVNPVLYRLFVHFIAKQYGTFIDASSYDGILTTEEVVALTACKQHGFNVEPTKRVKTQDGKVWNVVSFFPEKLTYLVRDEKGIETHILAADVQEIVE